ncbi:hypothetical protein [Microbacterium elymi]|uniref:Uncharacterized protein n=1 Tax=Microbacterium elymi TaxID=2909587 RepID=A0ABY5NL46_9MICO|nr:hypothetical protein [Microbacterium elymi]UUT35913.1 hypothetical protein L2X98_22460 [Microbacterium elymi]
MLQHNDTAGILRSGRMPGVLPFSGIDGDLLTALRPGAHVLRAEWESLFAEGRLRTRARAVALRVALDGCAFACATACGSSRPPAVQGPWIAR